MTTRVSVRVRFVDLRIDAEGETLEAALQLMTRAVGVLAWGGKPLHAKRALRHPDKCERCLRVVGDWRKGMVNHQRALGCLNAWAERHRTGWQFNKGLQRAAWRLRAIGMHDRAMVKVLHDFHARPHLLAAFLAVCALGGKDAAVWEWVRSEFEHAGLEADYEFTSETPPSRVMTPTLAVSDDGAALHPGDAPEDPLGGFH